MSDNKGEDNAPALKIKITVAGDPPHFSDDDSNGEGRVRLSVGVENVKSIEELVYFCRILAAVDLATDGDDLEGALSAAGQRVFEEHVVKMAAMLGGGE